MSVSREDVLKIARLAELAVDESDAERLRRQLSGILDYVEQLGEVPHDDAAPDDAGRVRLRPDEPDADPLRRPPADFAPAFQQGLFTVPRRPNVEPEGGDA